MIVDIDQSELHSYFFFSIIIIELHLSQQKLSIIIVLNLKVSSFGHVSDDLSRIISCLIGLVDS
jgi:hypothetical protein